MFATFETHTPDEPALRSALAEAYSLRRLGDNHVVTLALWTDCPGPQAYEVEADTPGPDLARPVTAASVIWFDGPMSQARLEAARFGYRARIAPALASVPGMVRTLVLWRQHDASSCAVTLAVDLATLDACGAAVSSTELLPGEEPALLAGPDRVDVHHATAHLTSQGAQS